MEAIIWIRVFKSRSMTCKFWRISLPLALGYDRYCGYCRVFENAITAMEFCWGGKTLEFYEFAVSMLLP